MTTAPDPFLSALRATIPPYDAGEIDEWEDDYDPDEEFLDYECGMMHDGQCTKAGSEECDWECPRNR